MTNLPVVEAPGLYLKSFELIAPMLAGKRLLDIGCGNGVYLQRSEAQGIGLDRALPALLFCWSQELQVAQCDFNADTLPVGDETFDAVLCSHILEHVHSPIRLLAECNRVLNKNGTIVVGLPVEGLAKRLREGYFSGHGGEHGHIYGFTIENTEVLLHASGFQVTKVLFEIPRLTRLDAPLRFFRWGNWFPHWFLYAVSHAYWVVARKSE